MMLVKAIQGPEGLGSHSICWSMEEQFLPVWFSVGERGSNAHGSPQFTSLQL